MNRLFQFIALISLAALCLGPQTFANNDWLIAEVSKPLRGVDLPISTLRNKENTFYTGIKYAGGANDVMYLAFDCKRDLSPHDELHIYIPDHPRYGKPVRIRGKKKADRYLFSITRLEGNHGDVKVQHTIDLSVRSLWDDNKLDVDIENRCDLTDVATHRKCNFTLKGSLKSKQNEHATIEMVRLIQHPELKARWDHRSSPPHVRGKIVMGKLALIPGSGMDRYATIALWKKDDPAHKSSKRFRMKPAGAYSEFTYYTGRRVKRSKHYNMTLTVDLKPFFGMLKASDNVVLR